MPPSRRVRRGITVVGKLGKAEAKFFTAHCVAKAWLGANVLPARRRVILSGVTGKTRLAQWCGNRNDLRRAAGQEWQECQLLINS
jgi:hypothetical protein